MGVRADSLFPNNRLSLVSSGVEPRASFRPSLSLTPGAALYWMGPIYPDEGD
jgi:hypothetical protein